MKIINKIRIIIAHEFMNLALNMLPAGSDEREDFAYLLHHYMKLRLDDLMPKFTEKGGEA